MSAIDTGTLQDYVSARAEIVKPNTVRNELTVLKLIFKYALKWSYVRNNPTIGVERPEIEKPEIEILSPDEFERLLQHSAMPYRVAFLTAFLTGLRAGELWGLQWSDVDWYSKQIHVKRSLYRQQFQKPKTKTAIRDIDLTDRLARELYAWKLVCPTNDHNLVFPSPQGKMTQHDNMVKRYFNSALRSTRLKQVSFHSLRHSNASFRIHVGQNVKYIQKQLGHESIDVTMDIYGHLFDDQEFNRKKVELLESVRKPLEKTNELQYAAL